MSIVTILEPVSGFKFGDRVEVLKTYQPDPFEDLSEVAVVFDQKDNSTALVPVHCYGDFVSESRVQEALAVVKHIPFTEENRYKIIMTLLAKLR